MLHSNRNKPTSVKLKALEDKKNVVSAFYSYSEFNVKKANGVSSDFQI